MKGLHTAAWLLLLVGGLNWLLVALFSWDVGSLLGGMSSLWSRLVYLLVGLAALYELFTHKGRCKDCMGGNKMGGGGMGSSM